MHGYTWGRAVTGKTCTTFMGKALFIEKQGLMVAVLTLQFGFIPEGVSTDTFALSAIVPATSQKR